MREYDKHLVNIHGENTLISNDEIYSDEGVLLVKNGITINTKISDKLLRFKLLKPLEDSISISNQLNAKSIYNLFIQLINQDQWLKSIHSKLGDKVALQRCCLRLEKFPILLQKLTVMKGSLFNIFEQAIFSAYLAYICAITDQREQSEVEEFFLAGIFHDIGFLHIDNGLLNKKGDLTPVEWRNLQAHPVIGYEIVKLITHFPKNVARAILEHHEENDGSGYPKNKDKSTLCDLGQIINLLDTITAIYNKKIKQQNRSIRSVIPVIQINIHSYSTTVASLVINTLKHAAESTPNLDKLNTLSVLVNNTKQQQQYVQETTIIIKDANKYIGYNHSDKEMLAIQNKGNNILLIVNSAGLNDTRYYDSFSDLSQHEPKELIHEVEDANLMLGEVIHQINTYKKSAHAFTHNKPSNPLSQQLIKYIAQVEDISQPVLSGSFKHNATN
jgi:hypothetical protein